MNNEEGTAWWRILEFEVSTHVAIRLWDASKIGQEHNPARLHFTNILPSNSVLS